MFSFVFFFATEFHFGRIVSSLFDFPNGSLLGWSVGGLLGLASFQTHQDMWAQITLSWSSEQLSLMSEVAGARSYYS